MQCRQVTNKTKQLSNVKLVGVSVLISKCSCSSAACTSFVWGTTDFNIISIYILQNTRHSLTGPSPEYRLKEKYYLRKIEINNLDDTEGR